MKRAFGLLGLGLFCALVAAAGASIPIAWASNALERVAAGVDARGWTACTLTETSISTAGAVPATALANRGHVTIAVDHSEADWLYCSIGGTPVATAGGEWTFQLTGADSWAGHVATAEVITCIADSGTIVAHVTECTR